MIPKIIHYCWFGGNPLPELAQKCIASWKKYCPDYEIKEWNESNFDLNCCDYVREAYEAKRWAFVSDVARFWVLYQEGGIYFDTDVEIIKPLDDILERGAFWGCEKNELVAPGLGMAANPGLGIYKEVLDFYKRKHFRNEDGLTDTTTIVEYTSRILKRHGWKPDGTIQKIENITIYPPKYFCPMNYQTGKITITADTYTIHHYSASWYTDKERKIISIQKKYKHLFGERSGAFIASCICIPLRLANRFEMDGIKGILQTIKNKLLKENR